MLGDMYILPSQMLPIFTDYLVALTICVIHVNLLQVLIFNIFISECNIFADIVEYSRMDSIALHHGKHKTNNVYITPVQHFVSLFSAPNEPDI